MTRCTHVSNRTTWAARANARSTAAGSPAFVSTHTFDLASPQMIGASGATAARLPVTAGSGSQSTTTRSAASRAAAGVSATTMATMAPTKRARSAGIGGCGATKSTSRARMTSSWGFAGTGVCVIGFTPSAAASRPVSTAITPGAASAAAVSTRTIRA